MDFITTLIVALFAAIIFYGILFGVLIVGVLSIVGMIKGLHERKPIDFIIFTLVFTFLYVGVTTIVDKVQTDGIQVEITSREKEDFIHNWLFKDDSIALEEYDEPLRNEKYHRYYVMTEHDRVIYEVDVYNEKAFGLFRYSLEPYNKDYRVKPAEQIE